VTRGKRHRPSAVLTQAVSVEYRDVKPTNVPEPVWSGICPAGLHGIDFEGQDCKACASSPLTEEQCRKIGAEKARFAERAAWRAVWSEP